MGRILTALAAIALAFFFWHEAAGYPATAARLPNLLGSVVLILAVLAIAQELLFRRRAGATGMSAPMAGFDRRNVAIGAGFVGLIVLYAWGIQHAGYLIATPIFLLVPLIALRPVGWGAMLATAVAVTGVIWGVFVYFLNLPIPLYPAA